MSLLVLKICEICLFLNKSDWYLFALQEHVWQKQCTHIFIRSNKMQQYAGIYLLQNYSTYFGRHRTHHQEYIKP